MLHRTAKLTPFGRRLLVERVVVEGWSGAIAAEMLGVSRATAYLMYGVQGARRSCVRAGGSHAESSPRAATCGHSPRTCSPGSCGLPGHWPRRSMC